MSNSKEAGRPQQKESKQATQKKSFWKSTVIVSAIIGAAAIIVAALIPFFNDPPPPPPVYPAGRILSPHENDRVPSPFPVNVELQGIPEDHHVWVAIKIGNLFWPKKEIARNARSWNEKIEEGGDPGKRFTVVLFMVPNDGHREIESWFDNATQSGEWGGMGKISNKADLATVNLRLQ